VTALPAEAAPHADSLFLGPGEETFPQFLSDLRQKKPQKTYFSAHRTLTGIPPVRRDLIKRSHYLVPNSLVVTRGCPHHCDFCYKDAFFQGGKGFYVQQVDDALAEIDRLPGRHLYFLDDHLLGNQKFATELFTGMQGMNRVFQGASTVDAILRGNLIEQAAAAGLRSLFVGFETLSAENLKSSNKKQNLGRNYQEAIQRLHSLGIMVNGSFVFGLDDDGPEVFEQTVNWAVQQGITTATFHVLTPYPGTKLFADMEAAGRILTRNWDLYDTRQVVYQTRKLSATELKAGYDWAYDNFYSWSNILQGSLRHDRLKHQLKHFAYAGGWKKFEPLWNFIIKSRNLRHMRPLLESILSKVNNRQTLPSPAPPVLPELPVLTPYSTPATS
jgi:radical SAM superfamily enzyme YgiQ (UPF0313 family)